MPMPTLAVALGAFASFGGFLFGYDTGYIAGCKEMPYFKQVYGELGSDGVYYLPSSTNSLITSILSAGTFVGALCGSLVGDRLGRRYGIILYIVLFFIGVALQTGCENLAGFSIGRVFAGLGVGGVSCLVPIYQAECAPKQIRGMIVSAFQFFITVGLLIAAVIVDATKNRPNASSYQIPIGVQFIWGAIIAIGICFLPESPRWLMATDRNDQARRALARLLSAPIDSKEVTEAYGEIAAGLEHERKNGKAGWADCFKQGESKALQRVLTGMAMQGLQQLTGINFIFYYGTAFFSASGITNPFIITIATNIVNTFSTPFGMWAADKVGRRPLMMIGAAGMGIAQLIVAITGTVISEQNSAGQKVLVAFVCIFIAFFATTWATLAWVCTSENPPYRIRAKAMSLSTATQWLFNFAIGYATPYLVDETPEAAGLGAKVFFIWGGCCVGAFFFAYFFIPETKQLSLEQIDLLWRNSTIRGSNQFRKELLEHDIHHDEIANYSKNGTRTLHVENDAEKQTEIEQGSTPAVSERI